jgi:hypothetical protein
MKQVPLQTFQVSSLKGAENLAANSAFLFYTIGGNNIQAMNKHGYTSLYFDLHVPTFGVKGLVPFNDELLFIIESNQTSFINVKHLYFNVEDSRGPIPKITKNFLFKNLPNDNPTAFMVFAA